MTVALQIRDVPDEVKDLLATEAKRQGRSVQAYLLGLVEREARLLHNVGAFERTASLRISLETDPVDIVRQGREDGFDRDREQLP
jgi:plasmid stability protein